MSDWLDLELDSDLGSDSDVSLDRGMDPVESGELDTDKPRFFAWKERYMGTREFSEALGISKRTARRIAERGEIPGTVRQPYSNRWSFPREGVYRMLDSIKESEGERTRE